MDTRCYFELRKASVRGSDSLAADLARHLHTRQHLGKTVVVSNNPAATLSALRKQWLKLSRNAQKQRAGTLNADKILKYTHTITHMQHLRFTIKEPLEQPEADVYVLKPRQLAVMPAQCWTVYVIAGPDARVAKALLSQLPSDALIVDYHHVLHWSALGLGPKKLLEEHVHHEWHQAKHFLRAYSIDTQTLMRDGIQNINAIDDALDTLLSSASQRFMGVAAEFHRTLELARPLRLSKQLREEYDSFLLLAHRVQALTPGAFTRQFLETYNEDDTFLLHDGAKRRQALVALFGYENPAAVLRHHLAAGRFHLARALQLAL